MGSGHDQGSRRRQMEMGTARGKYSTAPPAGHTLAILSMLSQFPPHSFLATRGNIVVLPISETRKVYTEAHCTLRKPNGKLCCGLDCCSSLSSTQQAVSCVAFISNTTRLLIVCYQLQGQGGMQQTSLLSQHMGNLHSLLVGL